MDIFSRATRSRRQAARPLRPAGSDWSEYRSLKDAARAYFLHADIALDAVQGVLGRRRVRGFTLERVVDLSEAGASVWQEAAVCDGRRLILWHSEERADPSAPGRTIVDSSLQVLPLEAIEHVGMRTVVGRDEHGKPVTRGVYLVVSTGTPHELTAPHADSPDSPLPGSLRFRPESFRFSKSLEDGGPGQMARLTEFGRLLGRLVPR